LEGKPLLEKDLHNATQIGDPGTLGLNHLNYGSFYWIRGDWKQAKEHLEKCLIHSEEAKFYIGVVLSLCFIGYVHSFLGDPETGRKKVEKGLQMFRDSGIELFLSVCCWIMGSFQLESIDLENAQSSMEEALMLSRKNHEKGWEGVALVGLGRVLGKKEPQQKEKVEEYFYDGLGILDEQRLKPWYAQGRLNLGEFYLDAGQKEKALENLKEAEALFQEMGMEYWLAKAQEALAKIG
jgi:tetratricopeptide (TPR) repeat protein